MEFLKALVLIKVSRLLEYGSKRGHGLKLFWQLVGLLPYHRRSSF